MKVVRIFLPLLLLAAFLSVSGCAQSRADNSQAAIDHASTLNTAQEKVDYLISQGRAFYNSQQFQQAVDIARYILNNVDKDSAKAKTLLEDAKAKLSEMAANAVTDAKKSIQGFGK